MIFGVGTARLTPTMTQLVTDHAAAVRDFVDRAASVSSDQWNAERAPGKWTPAQEAKHLALGYTAFLRDLRGGPTFRLRGRWWQRRLWRWRVLPQILGGGRIPHGARAPREARPPERPGDRSELLGDLNAHVAQFEVAITEMQESQPRRQVIHPYFGALTLSQLVRFCTVHTRHHTAFLPTTTEHITSAMADSAPLISSDVSDADRDAIVAGLVAYNAQHGFPWPWRALNLVLRDADGAVLGGLLGDTNAGWLFIKALWVAESQRGRGYGSQLLAAAEQEAKSRGCLGVYLDTYSFQARPFYERAGYRVFGEVPDHPPGGTKYYLAKKFVERI